MTRAVRSGFLKDENGAISDHLRNHVHLTNCIHLKNHMHRQSPILAERLLMRDLIVLQRSRSLRDPSTSPPSWHSPSVIDSLSKKFEKEAGVREGRRSVGSERRREGSRLSGSSPPIASVATSKVAAAELARGNDGGAVSSDRSSMGRARDSRGIKGEDSSRRNRRSDISVGTEEPLQDSHNMVSGFVPGNVEGKTRKGSQKGRYGQDVHLKTLSEQLNEFPLDSDDVESSHIHRRGRRTRQENASDKPETSIYNHRNGLNKVKKRKFRNVRRPRATIGLRDIGAQNELSVASNTLAQGSTQPRFQVEEGEEQDPQFEVTQAPRNGCGIPWNWSRIHHRGKTFLDMAGRSLSCGLSDSRLRKGGPVFQGRDSSGMPLASDHSGSSTKSDAEALPLLVEPSGSQESTENAAWVRDYSGELGIFADHALKRDVDSDLASEARSGGQLKPRGNLHARHQSLTQKYMPRTFKDLVGQNLVAQALSNAVIKRKVGLLYVFYGPHGTGKTSCARIFARALNCQSPENPKPCGVCSSCIAHDLGKSRNVREVGPVSNVDFESVMDLLDNMIISQLPFQYRVFIFDDCDNLPHDSWSAISKVIDRAPRRMVFILVSTSLDNLPHMIMSRCQKFFFPKLKDADIIYALQCIATKEDLEIDKDALKLIASRSDGSLRDAEMTLEQLSLLGQRISVPLVQELVGLISDEKLVDLLDLALSADTVNTVKNLREIMEAGVEPLALMSQLATIITDILAGSYVFTKERLRRKFFRRQTLSKEDMEKLRQALKTLSEAEKQLRMSNDKLTWLTAALLQLAPDQQYMLPSSAETSFNHSPLALNNTAGRDLARNGNIENAEIPNNDRGLSSNIRLDNHGGSADDAICNSAKTKGYGTGGKRYAGRSPQCISALSMDFGRVSEEHASGKGRKTIDEIWLAVLEKIQNNALKQFMCQEAKLVSVSFGAAPTVQLIFSSPLTKSKAEKFRGYILQAFEATLGSPLILEIRCESRKDARAGLQVPLILPASKDGSSQMMTKPDSVSNDRMPKTGNDNNGRKILKDRVVKGVGSSQNKLLLPSLDMATSEIVELVASPRETKKIEHTDNNGQYGERNFGSTLVGQTEYAHQKSTLGSQRRKFGEQSQSQSLVRSKVSLAHVIQQAEGCTQRSGWSRRKAMSIAEKLEQENLRLEPRSRSLLCWKACRATRGKLSRLKVRTRRSRSLLKLFPCSRCLSTKSRS
ncbi:PREDICTED: protein STICHEL-like 3 isoform X2 [Nelumbo nucifera]|uniref:Protein STICHEL-like 3 isoform X2 n=1 Tax=Nelumbo nucifera TaxID=4432 RepID=A0A1U7YSS8_NELNU|nr:PREDICTED: protein STICHEL-like 3 isoform X2 [Nelumbo nucifera]